MGSSSSAAKEKVRLRPFFLAATGLLAAGGLARAVLQAPFVPELMADGIFGWVPMPIFSFAVRWLGVGAKWVAFAACILVYWAAAALVGWAVFAGAQKRWPLAREGRYRALAALFATFLVAAGTWAAFGPGPWRGERSHPLWPLEIPALMGFIVSHLLFAAALYRFHTGPGASPGSTPSSTDRRRFLGSALRTAAGVGVLMGWWPRSLWGHRFLARAGGIVAQGNGLPPGMPSFITPVGEFYTVSKNLFDPRIDVGRWVLEVRGHVEQPLRFTYDELRALAHQEQLTTLTCISNEVGGDLIGNGQWRGVPLRTLLEQARLQPGVVDIVFRAQDRYSDSIPLERALHPATLIAVEMNGAPLEPKHGYPARLIVPGLYGMKNVKWTTAIEAHTSRYEGYWQGRGWSYEAIVETSSQIRVPDAGSRTLRAGQEVFVGGIAFAGDRGIQSVEFTPDNGATWYRAEIRRGGEPNTWALWTAAWRPPAPGVYELVVRAVDGHGTPQTEAWRPPLPEGATGLHRITVRVLDPLR